MCVCVVLLFGAPCISIRVSHTILCTIPNCAAILVFFVGRLDGSRGIIHFFHSFFFFLFFQYIHNVIVCALVQCTYAAPAAVLVDRGYIRHTKHLRTHKHSRIRIYTLDFYRHHIHMYITLYKYNHNNNNDKFLVVQRDALLVLINAQTHTHTHTSIRVLEYLCVVGWLAGWLSYGQ